MSVKLVFLNALATIKLFDAADDFLLVTQYNASANPQKNWQVKI
jgi:hypothetical protein